MAVALYKQLILVKWQPAEATLDPAAELLRLRRQNRKSSMGTRGFYEYDMRSLKHIVFIPPVKLQPCIIWPIFNVEADKQQMAKHNFLDRSRDRRLFDSHLSE